jgi:hypothetical protein
MDILDDMGVFNFMGTSPSIGFVPPLPAADYTFWVQEGANGIFPYNFEFVLRAVPEPTSLLLIVLAGLAVGMRWRFKRPGRFLSLHGRAHPPRAAYTPNSASEVFASAHN